MACASRPPCGCCTRSSSFQVIRPDGSERFIRSQHANARDVADKPVNMTGTSHDMTERKRAGHSARPAHEQLRLLAARLNHLREADGGLVSPGANCKRSRRLQPDDETLAENAYRLCNARQLGPIVRVEEAADFLFVDAESFRQLSLADACRAHRNA
jgi:hypothetical protein